MSDGITDCERFLEAKIKNVTWEEVADMLCDCCTERSAILWLLGRVDNLERFQNKIYRACYKMEETTTRESLARKIVLKYRDVER